MGYSIISFCEIYDQEFNDIVHSLDIILKNSEFFDVIIWPTVVMVSLSSAQVLVTAGNSPVSTVVPLMSGLVFTILLPNVQQQGSKKPEEALGFLGKNYK